MKFLVLVCSIFLVSQVSLSNQCESSITEEQKPQIAQLILDLESELFNLEREDPSSTEIVSLKQNIRMYKIFIAEPVIQVAYIKPLGAQNKTRNKINFDTFNFQSGVSLATALLEEGIQLHSYSISQENQIAYFIVSCTEMSNVEAIFKSEFPKLHGEINFFLNTNYLEKIQFYKNSLPIGYV